MNLSDLSIEGLTQLEARLTSDLEMVKRVKALVMEYQKMGMRSGGVLGGAVPGAGQVASPVADAGAASAPTVTPIAMRPVEERLEEALAATSPDGFILDDLWKGTYSSRGCIDKDTIKSWVKRKVREGKVRVVQVRSGRIGSVYAAVRDDSSSSEG